MPLIDGVGLGIGAMTVVMLGGMPLTAVLLVILFLQSDATDLISVVIVAVVVAWVTSARLTPWLPPPSSAPATAAVRPPGRPRPTLLGTEPQRSMNFRFVPEEFAQVSAYKIFGS